MSTQRHVLIADDEPNIVVSLEFLMKREGHRVSIARDGDAALAAIRELKPDLVLLDVMMPGKTGFEVCQAVRADDTLAADRIAVGEELLPPGDRVVGRRQRSLLRLAE